MEERWREPAALAEQYAGMLYRLAYARTGSRADAEDVMQEVFVRLLRARPEFRDEEHAKAWLLRVGARCAADVLRAPWRRREGPLDDGLPAPEPPGEGGVVEAVLALPAQYVYAATGVMFRATRQVLPPLWVAATVCVFDLLGCLGLGLGWFGLPCMGYMGIAWANAGAQCLGAVANCLLLCRAGYLCRRAMPTTRWLRAGLPYLLKVALPAGAAQIVWQSGYLMLFVLVASLPFDSINALAGLTAGLRIEALLFLPGMAFNMSVSVLVGNCLGMGEPAKAKRVALQMIVIASLGMSVVAALLWPFRAELAALLSHEAGTQAQIINYLTYNLLSTPFSIASTVMGGVMVGAGATRYNLMVYGGTFWLVRLPLGWLLGHWLWGTASGVFLAMLVSQCLQTAIMFYVLLYRDWARFAMRARHHHDNR